MTVFDYFVVMIVTASLLLGMWRGVVGEIIALVAWVLAFFAALPIGLGFLVLGPVLAGSLYASYRDVFVAT